MANGGENMNIYCMAKAFEEKKMTSRTTKKGVLILITIMTLLFIGGKGMSDTYSEISMGEEYTISNQK